ncbi:MAG: hypothetical protein ACE5JA_02535 [bacterium]
MLSKRADLPFRTWLALETVFLLLPLSAVHGKYDPTTLVFPSFGHTMGYHKAGGYFLKLFLGEDISFRSPEGICAKKLTCTDDPTTTKDDDEMSLFAVSSRLHQIIYNQGLLKLTLFGRFGRGEGEFWNPHGIAATVAGDVYVADTGNDRVVILKSEGRELRYVSSFGRFGLAPGEFDDPVDVACDSRGRVYVTDMSNNRVQVFDPTGKHLYEFGGDYLRRPTAIAVLDANDPWTYYRESFLVVVDENGKRVTKFSLQGRKDNSITYADLNLETAKFAYTAIDYYNNVYLTDSINCEIHKLDRSLRPIVSFGRKGTGEKEFLHPTGITIWKRFGQVFILDQSGAHYYWVGVDAYLRGFFPPEFGQKEKPGTTVSIYITEPALVGMKVYDSNGALIRELLPEFKQFPFENDIVWNGLDSTGSFVQPGVYTLKISVEPTYSSKKYFKKELSGTVRVVSSEAEDKEKGIYGHPQDD